MPVPAHVIWITADHLRFDALGCHGSAGLTPHLDALARGGVDVLACYGQNPLCMPSRASFMTGCYPGQTGVTSNGIDLPADFPFVISHLLAARYRSVQVGKLHLQCHDDHDLTAEPRQTYGFDRLILAEEPGCYDDAYTRWLASEHPALVQAFRLPRPAAPARAEEARRGWRVDAPWIGSFSGFVATQVDRLFGAWGGPAEPQFVHAGFYAPHPPLNPTAEDLAAVDHLPLPEIPRQAEEWTGKPGMLQRWLRAWSHLTRGEIDDYRRHYRALVYQFDRGVGMIVDRLKRQGLFDDTLIIVSSDHGDYLGEHGQVLKNPAPYDSLLHLPLLLHWPKGFPAGQRISSLVELVDVVPTILGACNLPIPEALPGHDLSAALRVGQTPSARADAYAFHAGRGGSVVSLRTEVWKYVRCQAQDELAGEVLFDLTADPREWRNLAEDPAHGATLARLRERAFDRHLQATRPTQRWTKRF